MLVLLLAVCALAGTSGRLYDAQLGNLMEWGAFKSTFNKQYSDAEEVTRRGIFTANVDKIIQHNREYANGKHSWHMAVNQFADLTKDEFGLEYMGSMPKQLKDRPRNWQKTPTWKVPASSDWTSATGNTASRVAVSPVKNQGQCGSCWAFSTVGGVEGAYALLSNVTAATSAEGVQQFSEQELVSCAGSSGNQGCQGGLMDNAFKWIEKNGLNTEDAYPYVSGSGNAPVCESNKEKPAVVYVTQYTDVPHGDDTAMTAALAKQPVSIAIEADKQAFQFYSGGVLTGTACGDQLDHGVLAVGYGTYTDGKDYYKVKNSWGPTWGMNGFILLGRGKDAPGNGEGECGLLQSASYPSVRQGSPPGPSPGPGPGPSPSTDYYGDPANGACPNDQQAVQIQGITGAFCSPKCKNNACPAAPSGWTGTAACALRMGWFNKYCAIECTTPGAKCNDNQMTCKSIQGTGICTYDDDSLMTATLASEPIRKVLA